MVIRSLFLISIFLLFTTSSSAQFGDISKRLGFGAPAALSDEKIASGLKEALMVGAENAVKLTGQTDGYFSNEAIKILMPGKLKNMEKGLRAVGYGQKIDDFVLSMNRSAEKAAPEAQKIFSDAILEMSFDDARKILQGGDTAATEYFKDKTTGKLTAAFKPVVEKTMNENGVKKQYDAIVGKSQSIPFMKKPNLDISQYVVSEALEGLFYTLGQEEMKIRKDPLARTTSVLKEVFGK